MARVEGISWNTVARWLEKAADACRRFNRGRIAGFVVEELQSDEIRSFSGGKTQPTWIFVAIEHRDLKPDNLMQGYDGRLKILDFGLAKLKQEWTQPGMSSRDGAGPRVAIRVDKELVGDARTHQELPRPSSVAQSCQLRR